MKAHLEQVFFRDGWNVWLYERSPSGTRVLYGTELKLVDDYAEAEPSLFLRNEALEALLDAADETRGVRPASGAVSDHLADAITVRDRLLTLVEQDARP